MKKHLTKRFFAMLIALSVVFTQGYVPAKAADDTTFEVNDPDQGQYGFKYRVTDSAKKEVTLYAHNPDKADSIPQEYSLPGKVTYEGTTYTVTSVEGAKENQSETGLSGIPFRELTLPSTLTSIGDYGFSGLTNLMTLTFPSDSKITSIGDYAFYNIATISFSIPASVESIGNYAFAQATYAPPQGDYVFTIEGSNTSIGNHCFENCNMISATLPSEGSELGTAAFKGCENLAEVNLPSKLTEIKEECFSNCKTLIGKKLPKENPEDPFEEEKSVLELPVTLQKINNNAFNGCKKLMYVDFSNPTETGLSYIGKAAFKGCSNLRELNLVKESISSQGLVIDGEITESSNDKYNGAFTDCRKLSAISLPEGIITLGDAAFYNCEKLCLVGEEKDENGNTVYYYQDLVIPASLETMGQYTFYGCAKIGKISFSQPSSLKTIGACSFQSCRLLTAISIPSGITKLEKSTFEGCYKLNDVALPSDITEIGDSAFKDSSLTTINLVDSIKSLGTYAFANTKLQKFVFPDNENLTIVPDGLFSNCSTIKEIKFNSYIKSIGVSAFQNCKELTSMTIPETVTENGLKTNIFYGCSKLQECTFENKPNAIPNNMFTGCEKLSNIVIPSSVTSIGSSAFSGCSSLTELVLPNGLTNIYASAFSLTNAGNVSFPACTSLKSVTFEDKDQPSSLTTIANSAFSGCSKLETFTLPEKLTTIGSNTFEKCTSFKGFNDPASSPDITATLSIPSIKSIGESAFSGCTGITSVNFETATNKSFNVIPSKAFKDCTNLTKVLLPLSITQINAEAFSGCKIASLSIPVLPNKITLAEKSLWDLGTAAEGTIVHVPSGTKADYETKIQESKINKEGSLIGVTIEDDYVATVHGIENTIPTITLNPGQTKDLKEMVKTDPADAPTPKIAWTSDNENFVSVDSETGFITALSVDPKTNKGEAIITGQLDTSVPEYANATKTKVEFKVTVQPGASAVVNNPITLTGAKASPSIFNENGDTTRYSTNKKKLFADGKNNEFVIDLNTSKSEQNNDSSIDDTIYWDVSQATDAIEVIPNETEPTQATVRVLKTPTTTPILHARTYKGQDISFTLNVGVLISSIEQLSAASNAVVFMGTKNINISSYLKFTPVTYDEEVEYISSNPEIASINEKGDITPLAIGTTIISATGITSGKTESFTLTVTNPINTITLDKAAFGSGNEKVFPGESKTVNASVTYKDGTNNSNDSLTWEIASGQDVITLTPSGNSATFTTLKQGSATIKVSSKLNASVSKVINVNVTEPSLTLDKTTASIYTNKRYGDTTVQLTAKAEGPSTTVTWTSSNPKYATVNSNGLVTAKGNGKTTITATANGISKTCVVTSYKTTLTAKFSTGTYKKGTYTVKKKKTKSGNVSASFNIAKANTYISKKTFSSSKKSVATINKKSGAVTIKKKGTTTITVKVTTKIKKKKTTYKAKFKLKVK